MNAESVVRDIAGLAGVEVGGNEPWDIRVSDNRFYDRVLNEGSLGLGETYMDGSWDCDRVDMFFDRENYKFKLKFLGREILSTKFGDVSCLVFRPYVQSGRVFKEKESLTIWVSDDDNKIPLLIKADLAVGSLKATLVEFKKLKNSFKIVVD